MNKEIDITSGWRNQDLPKPIKAILEKWQGIADEEMKI